MVAAWRPVFRRMLNMSVHRIGKSSETDHACLIKSQVRSVVVSRYILTIPQLDFSS